MSGSILIFDSLFDDLSIETSAAAERGWTITRWDGSEAGLTSADAAMHVRTRMTAEMLDRLSSCRVVARFGTGIDTVDLDAAKARGIAVANVRDYCVPEMTAHTLALALSLDRRIGELTAAKDIDWTEIAQQMPLHGRTTATVIGLGSIGRNVARTLVAMGLEVRAVSRHDRPQDDTDGIAKVPLDEGLEHGDFVFLHCALNATTAGLIGVAQIKRLKPHAILINTARLGLVDEAALAAALEEGSIGGAGIDARLAPDSPLQRLRGNPRLIVTPHVGWYSERSAAELRRRGVENTINAAEASRAERAHLRRSM